jgi:hypothetical protein
MPIRALRTSSKVRLPLISNQAIGTVFVRPCLAVSLANYTYMGPSLFKVSGRWIVASGD